MLSQVLSTCKMEQQLLALPATEPALLAQQLELHLRDLSDMHFQCYPLRNSMQLQFRHYLQLNFWNMRFWRHNLIWSLLIHWNPDFNSPPLCPSLAFI